MRILETDRLVLRTWELSDVEAAIPIYGDPVVMKWWPAPEAPDKVEARVKRFMERHEQNGMTLWAVERKEDRHLIGHCGYQLLAGGPETEIGWLLARDCWGRGYATEAARGAMAHAFAHRPIERLVAIARPGNDPSFAVMRRLGMTYATQGTWYDFVHDQYAVDRATAMKVIELARS